MSALLAYFGGPFLVGLGAITVFWLHLEEGTRDRWLLPIAGTALMLLGAAQLWIRWAEWILFTEQGAIVRDRKLRRHEFSAKTDWARKVDYGGLPGSPAYAAEFRKRGGKPVRILFAPVYGRKAGAVAERLWGAPKGEKN